MTPAEKLLRRLERQGHYVHPVTFQVEGDGTYWCHGITLRDHFATSALAGITALMLETPDTVAKAAYEYADAMLRERLKSMEGEDG